MRPAAPWISATKRLDNLNDGIQGVNRPNLRCPAPSLVEAPNNVRYREQRATTPRDRPATVATRPEAVGQGAPNRSFRVGLASRSTYRKGCRQARALPLSCLGMADASSVTGGNDDETWRSAQSLSRAQPTTSVPRGRVARLAGTCADCCVF